MVSCAPCPAATCPIQQVSLNSMSNLIACTSFSRPPSSTSSLTRCVRSATSNSPSALRPCCASSARGRVASTTPDPHNSEITRRNAVGAPQSTVGGRSVRPLRLARQGLSGSRRWSSLRGVLRVAVGLDASRVASANAAHARTRKERRRAASIRGALTTRDDAGSAGPRM